MDLLGAKAMVEENKIRFTRHKEANFFLILALCFGITMACINPPFQECDGWIHYLWASDVSYGNLARPVASLSHEEGVILVPKNFDKFEYKILEADKGEGRKYIEYLKSIKPHSQTAKMKLANVPSSIFYYPQAFGLLLGRFFDLSVYGGVLLSRICNLLVFVALAYWAVRITPVFKHMMAVIGLLPLTLYQAASDSPDAMLNGLCFLFIAMCFSYAYGDRELLGWKDVIKLSLVLSVMFLYKYVYVSLGLLVFLIPVKKFGGRKEYWKSFAIAMIPLVIFGSIALFTAASAVSGNQASIGGEGVTQLGYLRQHPKFIIQMLITTFLNKFNDWMTWLNTLGSLNYQLGVLIYLMPMYMVFVGCLDQSKACEKIRTKDRWLCFITFMTACLGVVMGIYIGDGSINKVGELVAQGIQGRYFIAVIPVFFAAVSQKGMQNRVKYFTEKTLGVMGVMLLYAVYSLYGHCM